MRRVGIGGGGVGISGAQRIVAARARTEEISQDLAADRAKHIEEQVKTFKDALETFALKYRTEINRDPVFRHQFIKMAKSIGIDPLASSKGFWADTIGVGTFYYDLGIQIINICLATRSFDGGLISMNDLLIRLHRLRGSKAAPVTEDDVRRAIKTMGILNGGYSILTLNNVRYILSVPNDMTTDSTTIIQLASICNGNLSIPELCTKLNWTNERALRNMEALIKDGLVWIDNQVTSTNRNTSTNSRLTSSFLVTDDSIRYYFPSVMHFGIDSQEIKVQNELEIPSTTADDEI